jgi:putative serine protease PepD
MILRTLVLALALSGTALSQEIKSEDAVTTMESCYSRCMDKAGPSVVAIKVRREAEAAPKPANPPGLRGRFGVPLEDVFAKRPTSAVCSGVIVEADGVILTTYFNVSGKIKSIKVLLPDGRELDAEILGYNGTYDLAALKVDAKELPVLKPARLDEIKAGQPLVALGRAPDGKGLTVNPGIVSAASRMSGKGIQLDAKLNYGNVGGPVVDLEGRLIAVSCKVDVKYASAYGQNSGVGFAITHDRFTNLLADLKAGKNEAEPRRPFLGIQFDQKSTKEGVELESVQAGGAAEKAGIKPRDIIVEFDGRKITVFEDLRESILRKSAGDKVKVKVVRGEETLEFDCTLGWAPGE